MKKRKDFSNRMPRATLARTAVLFLAVGCGNAAGPTKTSGGEGHRHADSTQAHGGHGQGHGGHHHRFDDAATWSKVFDDPARDAWQKPTRVVEVMGITPGMTVADVGAGTGYFEPYLSRAVGASGKVIAEDVEPDMVKWINERAKRENLANVTAVLGAAGDPKLGSASGTIDRILVVDTWHHVDDRPAFAKNLALSLKRGGSIAIVDFTMSSPHGPPLSARIAPEAVVHDLELAGLQASVVSDADLPHQYIVRGVAAP